MLRLKLSQQNKTESYSELQYEHLYFAQDLSYISCVTDASYALSADDTILVQTPYTRGLPLSINTTNVTVYGEIDIDVIYNVETYLYTYLDNSTLKQEQTCRYIYASNGRYYYNRKNNDLNSIFIDDKKYAITSDNTVTIKEHHYLSGDTLTINGKVYDITVYNNKTVFVDGNQLEDENVLVYDAPKAKTILQIYNTTDREIQVDQCFPYSERPYIFYKDDYYLVHMDMDGSNKYVIINEEDGLSGITYDEGKESKYEHFIQINDGDKTICPIEYRLLRHEIGDILYLDVDPLSKLEIGDEIIVQSNDKDLHYTTLNNVLNHSYIMFHGIQYVEQETFIENNILMHYDFIQIGDSEYQIHYTNEAETEGYIIYEDEEVLFNIKNIASAKGTVAYTPYNEYDTWNCQEISIKCTPTTIQNKQANIDRTTSLLEYQNEDIEYQTTSSVIDGNILFGEKVLKQSTLQKTISSGNGVTVFSINAPIYGLIRYNFIEINGIKYKVQYSNNENIDGTDCWTKYISIPNTNTYRLVVESIPHVNLIQCRPIISFDNDENAINDIPLVMDFRKSYEIEVVSDIYTNFGLFKFFRKNSALGYPIELNYYDFTEAERLEALNNDDDSLIDGTLSFEEAYQYRLYKIFSYIPLTVPMQTVIANNLHQEDLLTNTFMNIENDKAINRIVDMDRDIYYPMVCVIDGQEEECILEDTIFNEVDKITFDLHFRTRNETSWEINQDKYKDIRHLVEESGVTLASSFTETQYCNWNCFDYYDKNEWSKSANVSDLLGFLNFSTNDVYYQKDKLNRSFLRLSFYDSNDITNQTLLHTSTISIDEHMLYKKYIDNIDNKNEYDIINDIQLNGISVNTEPIADENTVKFTYDEDNRLSCHLEIENRYLTKSCAEGFYLYLFKENAATFKPKTIYMKVEFNHAGEGRKLIFTPPCFIDEYNLFEYAIPQFKYATQEDFYECVKLMKEGINATNLAKAIYIPIQIKFDAHTHRFVYYLPTKFNTNNNQINFNLFEIKVKDES